MSSFLDVFIYILASTVGGYFENGIGYECDTLDILNLEISL